MTDDLAPHRLPGVIEPDGPEVTCDLAILGSGMGGSTLAHALSASGARILVVERGDFLPREQQNWSPEAVFVQGRYRNGDQWHDAQGQPFSPGVHYYVGGNTKVFGATLPRFRETDFGQVAHAEGDTSGWPIEYADLEPHYARAEDLYRVHGTRGEDPTDPWRSTDYPHPAVEHEGAVADLADRLRGQGLKPFHLPTGIDLREGGDCVRCATCDSFPCMLGAKSDADVRALRPALASGDVRLLTRTLVGRLYTDATGRRVTHAVATRDGKELTIRAERFVLACGAVNTAALLLRSGLANGSGRVGRNYMVHNSTFLVAADPAHRNRAVFQKTLGLNDWYLARNGRAPLGNVQMLGKLQEPMVRAARPNVPTAVRRFVTRRSLDLYLTSEDLPTRDNRITLDTAGRITVHWQPNNLGPHQELVRRTTRSLRAAGYPLVFTRRMGIETNSHQCGTAVMGTDPATSVVDPAGRTHEHDNLWVADSSVFCSSAAVNPALTIAANAFRIAGGVLA
ncbi:GMC oxidoreductase [Streptomyces sp. CBMA156]|uniref:GMC oxidoreductase n=1 Tax=Streptomyces sp. CBMA156 TaxID=1930280 RepID=UPI001661D231|nr:GMC family oxidoreductase [Streptomyces sp. CBMA156]MBD0673118.1 dehydrogenase [Streptomyces sp. CBMA156]